MDSLSAGIVSPPHGEANNAGQDRPGPLQAPGHPRVITFVRIADQHLRIGDQHLRIADHLHANL
jgi:hypothetical protein